MKRTVLLIGGVATALIASKLLVENVLGIPVESLVRAWVAHAGMGTATVVALLLASDIVLPIPSSLIMILSGAAFGVLGGAGVALIGSIGGEWLGFELVRKYGSRFSTRVAGEEEMERIARIFKRHGAAAVVVTRALPVIMETTSMAAGLSKMSRWEFLWASLVGTLPIVFVYAYAGALSRDVGNLLPAVVILVATAGLAWVLYRIRLSEA
jgi:uncharacterized membrane protein YdjX (TVP38/TMEM64 family)